MTRMKKNILRVEEEVDRETGEVTRSKQTVQFSIEPSYVKLYLDCLGAFTKNVGLNESLNELLIETLRYMSYADEEQTIYLNSAIKSKICAKTGKTMARYNQAVTKWVKSGILKRVNRGEYQVNPFIFGKGDWRDIEHLRATFDFNTGEVSVDTERKPKPSQNDVSA